MTVIAVCGLSGVGKSIVVDSLCKYHGFERIKLDRASAKNGKLNGCETPLRMKNLTLQDNSFSSAEKALDYVTSDWKTNFVITNLETAEEFEIFCHRPFFMMITVTAPFGKRSERLRNEDVTMEELLRKDDALLYDYGLIHILPRAKITISNNGSLEDLQNVIARLKFDDRWNRPCWDAYFMQIARLASLRSNCMKRRVGAVVVKDKRVVATGYNGTARGLANCCDGGCPRCNGNTPRGMALDHCYCLHAEANALLECGRIRCEGATIYCTTAPCLGCSQKIIQAGIVRVVYDQEYALEHNATSMMGVVGISLEKFQSALPTYIDASKF